MIAGGRNRPRHQRPQVAPATSIVSLPKGLSFPGGRSRRQPRTLPGQPALLDAESRGSRVDSEQRSISTGSSRSSHFSRPPRLGPAHSKVRGLIGACAVIPSRPDSKPENVIALIHSLASLWKGRPTRTIASRQALGNLFHRRVAGHRGHSCRPVPEGHRRSESVVLPGARGRSDQQGNDVPS